MTEPKRFSAIVRRVWKETPALTGVLLEVPADVTASYAKPGQYVVLHTKDGKKVFIVIASPPGEPATIELLLGQAALEKLMPVEGQELMIEGAAGNGFPIDVAKGNDVVLFATGSAIAAIRPVIEIIRKNRADYGRVTLYIGAHSLEDFAYGSQFDAWTRDRIDIVRAVSKPWVQDLFDREPVPLDTAVAFVCGQKDMMEACTAVLVKAGLAADRIRRNW
jgi:sulfhydrogenase subunit gamma (sulfur reductase)